MLRSPRRLEYFEIQCSSCDYIEEEDLEVMLDAKRSGINLKLFNRRDDMIEASKEYYQEQKEHSN